MSSPYFLSVPGKFILIGKRPDGDSVRFVPQDHSFVEQIQRFYRLKFSKDGSIQLRLEGIDAPELHYQGHEQPLGKESRDEIIKQLGFRNVQITPSSEVLHSEPKEVVGHILTKAADKNGRLISYIVLGQNLPINDWVEINQKLLRKTINYKMLKAGLAYFLSYTSMPTLHRRTLKRITKAVRKKNLGVWQFDASSNFVLQDHSSIGPGKQLIFPKFFRRATDFLRSGNLTLKDWLLMYPEENDRVTFDGELEVPLSELVKCEGKQVLFEADLLDLIFLEK